jgi:fibronectin type 3 domain-containing protein
MHAIRGILLLLTLLVYAPPDVVAQSAQPQPSASAGPDTLAPHDPGFTKIMVTARAYKDSVVLRWAPGTPHGWRVANRTGYVVERRSGSGEFSRLTPDTLHPWLAFTFIDSMRAHPDHKYLGLVLNALWADSLLLEPDGADTVGDNAVRNTNLFGYALFAADNDPSIAEAMGLRFVDRTVQEGDRYTYRIRLNEARDYRIDPGEVDVEVRPARVDPPPVNLTARGRERRIELRWEPQPSGEYTGYIISRSADGGKKFTRMNTAPAVIVDGGDPAVRPQGGFTDTTVINYTVYIYRVHGITAFGEHGTPAEVRAFARDLTPPPAPLLKNPKQAGRATVQLAWDMPSGSPDLVGFVVLRSAFSDSSYHELLKKPLPKNARTYTDKTANEGEPYYIVASLDTAGNRAASFPVLGALIDTLPPAVPTGLRGMIDTAGVVHLTWNRNRERTLLGYRVLRANAPEHEFTQLTGQVWPDTAYTDTVAVRTLTRNVYYRIAAVNVRYNHSRPTAILALRRYDATPPEAPAFYDVQASDSAVALRWAPSSSSDVRSHVLSRRIPPSEPWTALATLLNSAAQYVDHAVQQGVMYEYRIEAVDSAGLHSPPGLTVQARPFDSGVRPAPTNVKASFDQRTNEVTLSWTYASPKSESSFIVVFRSRNGTAFLRYRSVEADQGTFVDREITGSGEYAYAVKVITRTGAESVLSAPARVRIEPPGQ